MGIFFVYILKSAVCLTAFYLFYRMLLSKETFHRFNRWALLSITALSFVLPFIELKLQSPSEMNQVLWNLEDLLANEALVSTEILGKNASTNYVIAATLLIYLIGILVFWGKHLFSFAQMFRLIREGKSKDLGKGIRLILHQEPVGAFSWMRYIVLSETDYEENGEVILTHEKAHIHHRHSWDLIGMDICLSLQWFNPAAWLMKQELQNVHEFEADEWVINQGVDAKRYQLLLIKKAVGTRLYSMANSFNHSNLKRRITMMVKKKSNPWARAKYAFVLPLAAIAVAAFARPEVSSELNEISSVKVSDLSAIIGNDKSDNIPSESISKFLHSDEKPSKKVSSTTEKKFILKGIVVDENGEYFPGVAIVIDGTKEGTITDDNGNFTLEVSEGQQISASYFGWQKRHFQVTNDGKKKIIVLKQDQTEKAPQTKGEILTIRNKKPAGDPLIIVDDKEIGFDKEALNKIDPSTIQMINVIKDPSQLTKYGEKGKYGVILVTTKK